MSWRRVLGSGCVELGELDSVRAKHGERGLGVKVVVELVEVNLREVVEVNGWVWCWERGDTEDQNLERDGRRWNWREGEAIVFISTLIDWRFEPMQWQYSVSATKTPTENVKFACHFTYLKLDNVFLLVLNLLLFFFAFSKTPHFDLFRIWNLSLFKYHHIMRMLSSFFFFD